MKERFRDLFRSLRLDQVMCTIPTGLFLVDRDQHIVYWNTEAERITGYPAEEALGKHCSFLGGIPCSSTCGLYDETVPKPIRSGACSIRSRSGRHLTLLKNVDLIRDDEGAIVGGIESFTDITRQVRLENQLRQKATELEQKVRERTAELETERLRLRTVLDAMSDLAYITSFDCRVDFMNRPMKETFGDYLGRHCYKIYGRGEVCPWCPLPAVLAGQSIRQERYIEANGRTYEIMHTPLQEADGTISKLSVFRDITERKQAEKNLRRSYRELDGFVHTVSHDLRTPLTPVIGYANLLREQYRDVLDSRALGILEEIEGQGQRMLHLMEDLLTLSRVGRLDPPTTPVATRPIVDRVVADLLALNEGPPPRIEIEELPPVAVPDTLLSEVFANLIGNALRYAGRPEKGIEIGSAEATGSIRIFVRDHGSGIPERESRSIFEIFRRGSTAAGTRGTGVGLATVRKIAQCYGGRAWVEPTPGGGSTFWVEFAGAPSTREQD